IEHDVGISAGKEQIEHLSRAIFRPHAWVFRDYGGRSGARQSVPYVGGGLNRADVDVVVADFRSVVAGDRHDQYREEATLASARLAAVGGYLNGKGRPSVPPWAVGEGPVCGMQEREAARRV